MICWSDTHALSILRGGRLGSPVRVNGRPPPRMVRPDTRGATARGSTATTVRPRRNQPSRQGTPPARSASTIDGARRRRSHRASQASEEGGPRVWRSSTPSRRCGSAGTASRTTSSQTRLCGAGASATTAAALDAQWHVPQSTESSAPWWSTACAVLAIGANSSAAANRVATTARVWKCIVTERRAIRFDFQCQPAPSIEQNRRCPTLRASAAQFESDCRRPAGGPVPSSPRRQPG